MLLVLINKAFTKNRDREGKGEILRELLNEAVPDVVPQSMTAPEAELSKQSSNTFLGM